MIGIICALNLGVYNAFGIVQIIPLDLSWKRARSPMAAVSL